MKTILFGPSIRIFAPIFGNLGTIKRGYEMLFKEQSEAWYDWLKTRKRNPVKPGSLATYRSYLNRWVLPYLGSAEIAGFGNLGLKKYVAALSADGRLGPKSVFEIASVVKQIVSSAVNEEGIPVYARQWNNNYVDLPLVKRAQQHAPHATRNQVERYIKHSNAKYSALYALLAGTGLRIGEARALRLGDDGTHTAWLPESRLILVKTAFWRGIEQAPKTHAGVRVIDLPERLNAYLQEYCSIVKPAEAGLQAKAGDFVFTNKTGIGPMHQATIQKFSLSKLEIEGFHVFRRFRVTHLRGYGVPDDIIKFWTGHAPEGMTDLYSKLAQNVELRKSWADRAGLGFEIPKRRENGDRPVLRTMPDARSQEMRGLPGNGAQEDAGNTEDATTDGFRASAD